jgi:hypothetical protein
LITMTLALWERALHRSRYDPAADAGPERRPRS